MSEEKNNGLFGENEPIDLGSDASFPDFPDSDFDSIFGTAEKKDGTHPLPDWGKGGNLLLLWHSQSQQTNHSN